MGALAGTGYGPGSLSSAYSNATGTRGCVPGTVVYGIPIGPPFHVPEPKSALRPAPVPMLETQPPDWGWIGRADTSACQNESVGVSVHAGAPGTGVPCASADTARARTASAETTAMRRGPTTGGP